VSRADRLERLDGQRVDAETEFTGLLIAALRDTAAGSWGLFGHNSDKFTQKIWGPRVSELTDLGEQIDAMRATLGLEPYALFAEFLASRGPVASNAPGEPKQAKSWLTRLGEEH
jgi:hypothetical protein